MWYSGYSVRFKPEGYRDQIMHMTFVFSVSFFFNIYFSDKISLDISCKLQTIHMKCQDIFCNN